jgi:hypothetical protein
MGRIIIIGWIILVISVSCKNEKAESFNADRYVA